MGRNSGGVMSSRKAYIEKSTRMAKELRALSKKLSVAQASMARARRASQTAAGGVYMAQNSETKARYEATLEKADKRYRAAVENWVAISSQLNALKMKYDRLKF